MSGEAERVDAYQNTIARMEPDIAMVDHAAAIASIAISLRRIADALTSGREFADGLLADKIHDAIYNGIIGAYRQSGR